MYQLWLDDLYPRAKFADGLAMIETLGHRKRIQIMRKEWIDEGKPRNAAESGPEGSEEEDTAVPTEVEEMGRVSESYPELMEDVQSDARNNRNEPQGQKQHELTHQNGGLAHVPTDDGNPDEDELDALLAETEAEIPTTPKFPGPLIAPPNVDDFADADELEAMAEVEAMAETQRPR
jgi:replication fork protection complex subunit Csm3/Swi3